MKANDSVNSLINTIIDNEWSIFDIKMLNKITGKNYIEIKNELRYLINNQQIFSIAKGKYCIRNFNNPYVIANSVLEGSLIAYWTALHLHNLTEQIPNTIFSLSPKLKHEMQILNIRYRFIKVKKEKFFGITQMGYGNEMFNATDIEKTILDCFDQPQYSGGYEELIRAFYKADINPKKIFNYGQRMGNVSVLKRIAYLSELFSMNNFADFQANVLNIVNKRYSLIDPFGNNTGEFINKWRVRLNIPKESLLDIINKSY